MVIFPTYTSIRTKPINLKEEDLHLFSKEFAYQIKETTLLELRNASILEDTIFSLSKRRFYLSHTFGHSPPLKKILKKLFLFLLPPKNIEKAVWIADEWGHAYFHWFADALTRLLAVENVVNKDHLTIILPDNYSTYPYIIETLELLNIQAQFYNPKRRLLVKHLILPSHTASTGNYNKEVIRNLRNRFLSKTDKLITPYRNIFISRAKAPKRKIINETEVVELLKCHGFEIHLFEEYTLQKQIEIMSQTKSLVGLHGAGLVNMLFMQEGGQVLELRNQNDSQNNCYFALASELGHDYYYQQSEGDSNDTLITTIIVDLDELKTNLALMKTQIS